MFRLRTSLSCGGKSSAVGGEVHILPANQPVTTVIRFSVRVPVLSEQIAVAPPIVSQAAKTCKMSIRPAVQYQLCMRLTLQ